MLPFLLPLVLILYGEFSKGLCTRYLSRLLFYTYTLSVLLPLYVESGLAIPLAICILLCGFGYVILVTESKVAKIFFSIALCSSVLSYLSIYFQDYSFLLSLPYYADYSHLLFRECLVIGITCVAIKEKVDIKDFKLEMFIASLWAYEHFLI